MCCWSQTQDETTVSEARRDGGLQTINSLLWERELLVTDAHILQQSEVEWESILWLDLQLLFRVFSRKPSGIPHLLLPSRLVLKGIYSNSEWTYMFAFFAYSLQ